MYVLPRVFPHKHYRETTLEQRVELLQTALAAEPRFSIAAAEGGLFIEIARECRAAYGPGVRLSFLCGRDAAERVAGWDYGRAGAWQEMLCEFDLLVAPRAGQFHPGAVESGSFSHIAVDPACENISASEVRRRIASGESWEELVPPVIRARVREFYTRTG